MLTIEYRSLTCWNTAADMLFSIIMLMKSH
nr:MAG TPA: hypothetical protein [Caudoviricetes sp.]DAQ11078.1 MAG TPA: hypothetical protein [Caudoviricetes sp.]